VKGVETRCTADAVVQTLVYMLTHSKCSERRTELIQVGSSKKSPEMTSPRDGAPS